jgi:hypothetical protein
MRYHSREYVKYLQSAQWRQRKLAFMKRHGAYCRACYRTDKLDCHHDDYARLGHEDDNDLWILCREHHQTSMASHLERCAANCIFAVAVDAG